MSHDEKLWDFVYELAYGKIEISAEKMKEHYIRLVQEARDLIDSTPQKD